MKASRAPGRWQWHSLRVRIMLATLMWVTLGIGGVWYSATRLFAKHVEQSYHEELEVHIKELAALVQVGSDGRLTMYRPLSDPRYLVPLSGFYWQVSLDNGETIRSASMTRGRLDESVAHDSSVHHHVESGPTGPAITYGLVRKVPVVGDVHYVIATDEWLLDETIARFERELVVWLAALAAALGATGMLLVAFGLRPLDRLTAATARLRSGAAERLEGEYPSEIAPLVADLNAFIDHNRTTVERARVEAGNLAHALRTPLAVITDEAERLSQNARTAEASSTLLAQSQIMVQQIEYQLARVRSAPSARGPGTASRVGEALPPLLSAMRRLHPDTLFKATIPEGLDTTVPMDAIDLSELLAILLDNAGKWSSETVTIEMDRPADALQIRIVDDGPGLTPEEITMAFQIGTRLDPVMPGSGLGLAIAQDIAAAYGLTMHLGARSDGKHGLEARITFPSPSADTSP